MSVLRPGDVVESVLLLLVQRVVLQCGVVPVSVIIQSELVVGVEVPL